MFLETFVAKEYVRSSRKIGFHPSRLPNALNPVLNTGYTSYRLLPNPASLELGLPRTSRPKLPTLKSGPYTSCFCRANPNVASKSVVELNVQVWPVVNEFTFVKPPSLSTSVLEGVPR